MARDHSGPAFGAAAAYARSLGESGNGNYRYTMASFRRAATGQPAPTGRGIRFTQY
jgi:hypothetical protein